MSFLKNSNNEEVLSENFEQSEKEAKQPKEKSNTVFALLIMPLLFFGVTHAFYMVCNAPYARVVNVFGLLLSFIFMWCFNLILLGIFRSPRVVAIVSSIFYGIFLVVNQFKIAYSDDPVYLSDFSFLNSTGTFMDILKNSFVGILMKYLVVIVGMVIALVYIYKLARKHNRFVIGTIQRVLFVVLPCVFVAGISIPNKSVSHFMLKSFFGIENRQNDYATTNVGYYFKFGVFSSLYGQMLESRLTMPEGYDPKECQNLLNKSADLKFESAGFGKPNIVMIFSESFFNIDEMEEVTFDKKVCSNFEKLKSEGILIDMISPSYGGISANVEYEMLTGSSIKFFTAGYIPYMQLYGDDKYFMAPSIIEELKNNGYKTHITSTWEPSLFNCDKVYEYFNVDEVDYNVDLKDAVIKGERISDDYMADYLIAELKNKPKDEKLFTMILTAQAHMPFNYDKYDKYDISIVDSELSRKEEETILCYAQGAYDADKQLKKVYDYIQTFEEPTMLIFYGDHLPYLKSASGDDITTKLKYFNTGDEVEDMYQRYHTQCLILANYDIGEDEISYLGPDLVMTYLINNMNMDVSPYYKWLYTTIDTLPASNLYVTVDKDGNKYKTTELPEEMQKTFDIRSKMNWMKFVDVES